VALLEERNGDVAVQGLEPMMRRSFAGALAALLGGLLLAGFLFGCSGSEERSLPPDAAQMVDEGSWYAREAWPHDGHPVESEHFVVYSDGAGMAARERLASLAEDVYAEVIDEMGVDPASMFKFPPDQQRIDLYANRYNLLEGGGARGYYAGAIVWSFDNESGQGDTSLSAVRVALKHELVHVVESLLKGRYVGDVAVGDPRRMPVWFSEGTAEAISGGSTSGAPRTLDQMNALVSRYGRINPISWRVDLPPSDTVLDAYAHYYYPMAELAVEYLLDPSGPGRSPKDLAAVMLDMGNDVPFADAFEAHMGIAEADYEEQFFGLMEGYLPQSEPPLEAIAVGLAVLLGAAVMAGTVVASSRRWPAVALGSRTAGESVWSRRARIGFRAEIVVSAVFAVGFAALLTIQIASSDLAPGAPSGPGYLVAAIYLVGFRHSRMGDSPVGRSRT
jgi:hypothetical protein